MASLERLCQAKFGRPLPARWLIEKVFAEPFCLLMGHLGLGTEITVHAVKVESQDREKACANEAISGYT